MIMFVQLGKFTRNSWTYIFEMCELCYAKYIIIMFETHKTYALQGHLQIKKTWIKHVSMVIYSHIYGEGMTESTSMDKEECICYKRKKW